MTDFDPEEVTKAVDKLADSISETVDNSTFDEIEEGLNTKDKEQIKTLIATDNGDREAINKWFKTSGGDKYPEVVHKSDDYLAVRTAKQSGRKAKHDDNNDGTYHAVWIIGHNDYSRFFIHRLQWHKKFENDDHEWSDEYIFNRLNIDGHLGESDPIKPNTQYRVQGDLRVQRTPIENIVDRRVDQRASTVIEAEKEAIADELKKEVPDSIHDDIWFREDSFGIFRFTLEVKGNKKTDELKSLQNDLNIEEEEVRAIQDEHDDWEKLTAKRRQKAIEKILSQRHIKPVKTKYRNRADEIDEKAIRNQAEQEVQNELTENLAPQYLNFGNHLIAIQSAEQQRESFVVPNETTLLIDHDEHGEYRRTIPAGAYAFDTLPRHQNA
jgi:hypothetical protein